jgi:hypothetical protein
MTQLQIAPPTVDDRLARLENLVALLSSRVSDVNDRLAVLKQTTDVALCDLQTLDYAVDEMADTTRALSRDVDVLATAALDAMKSIEKLEKA